MKHFKPVLSFSAAALALGVTVVATGASRPPRTSAPGGDVVFPIADIHWEYNSSANDLGVHVTLDGEDWKRLTIENPSEQAIFCVRGKGPYAEFGMTELFFEGAEPSLDDVPLEDLLAEFPEGTYDFSGRTVDGLEIEAEDEFSHAIPDGPDVFATVGSGDALVISWSEVTSPPPGFPALPIDIVGYQVIVESFQVTLPDSVFSLTISPEFVATLASGEHQFEVLAIEASGNQTLREGSFVK